MKPEFRDYLAFIGMSTPSLVSRVDRALGLCAKICDEEIKDIFVSDFIKEDGTREYGHLELLADNWTICMPGFLTKDSFQVATLTEKLLVVEISCIAFDLEHATAESRMSVTPRFSNNMTCTYKAARENCEKLMNITKKYFVPRLMRRV